MNTKKNLFLKKVLSFGLLLLLFSTITLQAADESWAGSIEEMLYSSGTKGKQYVLLIAIDRYEDRKWPDLKNPVKDTQEIKAILEQHYFVDEVMEFYNKDATKEQIFKCLISDLFLKLLRCL